MNNNMTAAIIDAKNKYESAVRRGSGVKSSQETFKTVLFNAYPDLIMLVDDNKDMVESSKVDDLNRQIKSLQANIEELNKALQESDVQNNELRKKLRSRSKKETDNAEN